LSSEERITRVINEYKQPIEVELTKGARGIYRWRIGIKGETSLQILREIDEIDRYLSSKYGGPPPNPTKPAADKPSSPADPHARMDERLKSIREAGEKLVNVWGGEGK
jgi:hypothetical protein